MLSIVLLYSLFSLSCFFSSLVSFGGGSGDCMLGGGSSGVSGCVSGGVPGGVINSSSILSSSFLVSGSLSSSAPSILVFYYQLIFDF